MPDLKIQNTNLHVEAIKPIDRNKLTEEVLKQLKSDGLDEVIFEQNDQLYIAYKDNMDLSALKINDDAFNAHSVNQVGQMFLQDDTPVKVIWKDDESKESFWTSPYKKVAAILDDPSYKAGAVGFVAGTISGVLKQGNYFSQTVQVGTHAGTAIGTGAAILRTEAELDDYSAGGGVIGGAVGYGAGFVSGMGLQKVGQYVANNPKVAIGVGAGAAAVIGTGIVLDLLSDSRKVANYSTINALTQ